MYLRASREVIAAQREVVLRHLAAPAGRDAAARSVPAPRPVLPGETLPAPNAAQDAARDTAQDAAREGAQDASDDAPEERPAADGRRDVHAAAGAVIRARTGDDRENAPAEPRPTVPEPAAPQPAAPETTVPPEVTVPPEMAVPPEVTVPPPARPSAHVGAADLSGRRPAPRVSRQIPRIVELEALPAPPESGTGFAGRRFLIVDDACGVALELADLLERHGAQVRVPSDVDGPCDGLVHLAALRPGAAPVLPQAFAGVRQALAGGLRWLVFASGAGGTFGHRFGGGAVGDPGPGAGLAGLARTIAREYPEMLVRALDVDTKDTPRAIAQRILAELLTADAPVVVGHEGGRRNALDLIPAGPPGGGAAAGPDLGPDGVVLLTGGARGATARVALEFARTSGCHVELVGRTPEPEGEPEFPGAEDEAGLRRALVAHGEEQPAEIEATVRRLLAEREIRRTLTALSGHAASVRYHAADVRKPAAVRAVLDDVYRRHRRLDGVVHGAGLAGDRLVRDTSPESFARVYRTKVDGAAALVQAVRPGLGFFVVLGGLAGEHGDRGQAGCAAAGDACGTLAHVWRRRLRGRVLVAEWGPWADGAVPPERAREHARHGVGPIDPDAGAAALLREIAHGDETRVVLTGTLR
ncbi:SDR family NAD(P)-dependent oxidoreductase [Actinomadura sp. NPDC048032]|uniref:SDR family NAD(P)-dependent oxidoreductase n=1 Tax=Actinomadura sp. NPDC048032 TaxID=3155747 RepID=UPI003411D452